MHAFHAPTLLFVTVCTKGRKPLLANAMAQDLILAAWKDASWWRVGRYMIMPDHLHFFCTTGETTTGPLEDWVAHWKRKVSKKWSCRDQVPLWQRDFWDRQLRTTDSYEQKWEYVSQNPVRAGLVKSMDDWPWQGEVNKLTW